MANECALFNVVSFIHDHMADAQTLGSMLKVKPSYILGLSGWETTWGVNRFATDGNNFFSLHGTDKAPFATGKMQAKGGKHPWMSTFRSYLASGQSFIAQFGGFARGSTTPKAFAENLVRSGFNSAKASTGGNPDFIPNTVTAIAMVEKRAGC